MRKRKKLTINLEDRFIPLVDSKALEAVFDREKREIVSDWGPKIEAINAKDGRVVTILRKTSKGAALYSPDGERLSQVYSRIEKVGLALGQSPYLVITKDKRQQVIDSRSQKVVLDLKDFKDAEVLPYGAVIGFSPFFIVEKSSPRLSKSCLIFKENQEEPIAEFENLLFPGFLEGKGSTAVFSKDSSESYLVDENLKEICSSKHLFPFRMNGHSFFLVTKTDQKKVEVYHETEKIGEVQGTPYLLNDYDFPFFITSSPDGFKLSRIDVENIKFETSRLNGENFQIHKLSDHEAIVAADPFSLTYFSGVPLSSIELPEAKKYEKLFFTSFFDRKSLASSHELKRRVSGSFFKNLKKEAQKVMTAKRTSKRRRR